MSALSDITTFARAGNATMVDSDGVLKWAPHNLLSYSEDMTNFGWTTSNSTVDSATDLTFTTAAGSFSRLLSSQPKGEYTLRCTISGDTPGDTFNLEIVDGADGSDENITVVTVPSTPTQFEVVADLNTATFSGNILVAINRVANQSVTAGSTITITDIHLYRSDLGGMADNPATESKYVPTVASAVYLPRTAHHLWDGSAWVNAGLLLESEARTNLVAYSEDFTDASWGKLRCTVALGGLGPDGATSLYTLTATETSVSGMFAQNTVTISSGATTSASGYARKGTNDWMLVVAFDGSSNGVRQWFNLATGAMGSSTTFGTGWSKVSAFIENQGSGLFRWSFTAAPTGTSFRVIIYPSVPADLDFDCTIGDVGYAGFVQLEAGSTPSSYIPTTGTTATRNAETLTIAAADAPWSGTAVSIQMEGTMTYADTGSAQEVEHFSWRQSISDRIKSEMSTAGSFTGRMAWIQTESGTGDVVVESGNGSYSPGINVPFNISSRHGSTFINGAVDGTALTADLTPTALPDLSATDLQIGPTFMGTIKLFRIWADDIGDLGLEQATS